MTVAWIGLAGTGLFMARFLKKAWAMPSDNVAWWFKVWARIVLGTYIQPWKHAGQKHQASRLNMYNVCMYVHWYTVAIDLRMYIMTVRHPKDL